MRKLLSILTISLLNSLPVYAQVWQPAAVQGVPAGAISYFALTACPSGWLEANGQTFTASQSATLYPLLNGKLPDLRGEFIRGWDHGRGVDTGRWLGTAQDEQLAVAKGTAPVVVPPEASAPVLQPAAPGVETRPRNVAMLPCIKL